MYYSRLGSNIFNAIGIESAMFDTTYVQHVCSRVRIADITQDHYHNDSPSNGGNGSREVKYNSVAAHAESDIYVKVITHEIGDSQNDAQLLDIIVEAVPVRFDGTTLAAYNYYDSGKDYPRLYAYLRSNAYTTLLTAYNRIIELVGLNMRPKMSKAGVNPWKSVMQTPAPNHTFSGGDPYASYHGQSADVLNHHESFVVKTPLNTKFRRTKLKYVCKYTAIIRAFTINYMEHGRRFG